MDQPVRVHRGDGKILPRLQRIMPDVG